MKTKLLFATTLLLSVCTVCRAQDNSKITLRPFGVGLHIEQFRIGDIVNDNQPVNCIILTFNPNNSFRIEPEIGYFAVTDEDVAGTAMDLTTSATKIGLGLYYMFQRSSLNFAVGAIVESYSQNQESYNGFTGTVDTYETSSFSFGPALSGEYFFGQHFSFGGRLGLMFDSIKRSTGSGGESKGSSTHTTSGLQVRFYF